MSTSPTPLILSFSLPLFRSFFSMSPSLSPSFHFVFRFQNPKLVDSISPMIKNSSLTPYHLKPVSIKKSLYNTNTTDNLKVRFCDLSVHVLTQTLCPFSILDLRSRLFGISPCLDQLQWISVIRFYVFFFPGSWLGTFWGHKFSLVFFSHPPSSIISFSFILTSYRFPFPCSTKPFLLHW